MPRPMADLIHSLEPKRTVLLLGAGASIPSGAPSSGKLVEHFSQTFRLPDTLNLSEIAGLAEARSSRLKVITELRKTVGKPTPTGGILKLPLYDWKAIYSTNYDTLVEDAYKAHGKKCRVLSCDYDFGGDAVADCNLYKLHGTIEKDECDGHKSRMILTVADYDRTEEYRGFLWDRFRGDLAGADLLIVGQSLADPDLNDVVKRAIQLNAQLASPANISLLLYTADEYRSQLYEQRGLAVTFAGINEFFTEFGRRRMTVAAAAPVGDDIVLRDSGLEDTVIEVANVSDPKNADISRMFNGWPASYSDIEAGFSFERNIAKKISEFLEEDFKLCAVITGAAGVGKSTGARQAIQALRRAGFRCWEHPENITINVDAWLKVSRHLQQEGLVGALFIDEAHSHLTQINDLVDRLAADDNAHLKLVLASTRNNWYPRVKSPNLFRYGFEFKLSRLDETEINKLLNLIERQPKVRELVEPSFSGFSKNQRRKRLMVRCEADMFVCLKNIFATEAFDDILLREYATLDEPSQDIYRHVAALESAGVKVHRQLIIRLLKLEADQIKDRLGKLEDIVDEYTIPKVEFTSGVAGTQSSPKSSPSTNSQTRQKRSTCWSTSSTI
jgi:hypothetical protein